jgi:hypothetical protein
MSFLRPFITSWLVTNLWISVIINVKIKEIIIMLNNGFNLRRGESIGLTIASNIL